MSKSHLSPSLPRVRYLSTLLAVTLSSAAFADAAPRQLADVVVSASGFEQEIQQAPASISVVTRQELETKQFRDLAEALADVEGIDVMSGTGKTGGLSISMRGMPSEYTLILIDGRRQNTAGDSTPNGFGAAMNSFMPPVSAIERIEVIRGPMSTLYGADAMGGVVNIITRKVAKEWHGAVGVEMGIPEAAREGESKKLNVYASGPIVKDLLGLTVRGSLFDRNAASRIMPGNGRDPAPAGSEQYSVGTRLSLTPNKAHEFWLDLDHAYTWYNNDDCRLGTRDFKGSNCISSATAASGYKDNLTLTRQQVAIGHKSRLDIGVLESSLMHTTNETGGRTLPTEAFKVTDPRRATLPGLDRELKTTNIVVDSKLVAPIGQQHVLTVGGQWWDAELIDGLLPQNKFTQSMWSVFAENEWHFAQNWTATFGARYDEHSKFGGHVSPRAYLVWNTAPNWTLKGGISEGFRAPSMNQLIDGVSGISNQGNNINIGNPNLKPETSRTTEISALYDSKRGLTASATLFHNDFKDKIVNGGGNCATNPISSCVANPTATYSTNVDEAETQGMELATRLPLAERVSLNLNYTYTESKLIQKGIVSGALANTPKHMANAQLRWSPTEQLSLWLRGEYRGDSRRFTNNVLSAVERNAVAALGENLKGYGLLHLGGSYKASKTLTLGANVFNLLDKDFSSNFRSYISNTTTGALTWGNDYTGGGSSISGVARSGRTLWLSANISF